MMNLEKIDDKIIFMIHGFVHRVEKSFNNATIPEPIILMILSFYYLADFFKDTECILTNGDQKVISTGVNLNAYGNEIIDCNNSPFKIH